MTNKTYGPTTVHKHKLEIGLTATELNLPASAFPLMVGHQQGDAVDVVTMWWSIPVDAGGIVLPPTKRRFRAFGTGHPVPGGVTHIGSAICGALVWHVFELPATN